MKLSFITDEATQGFEESIEFAKQNGITGFELRTMEDMAIDTVPTETLRAWRKRLDEEGFCVVGLAGSFYKCMPSEDAIAAELEKLNRLCDAADILGCDFIRGFAFFAPESGPLSAKELAPYFTAPIEILQKRGKTLLLEADPSVNTSNHASLAALIAEINSPAIRAIFDPGNCLYDPLGETPFPNGYEAIAPYFAHVHVKDAVRATPESYCVKIGTGEVNYAALLHRLHTDGYNGWFSMETHYRLDSHLTEEQMRLPGGAAFSAGGAAATAESIHSLQELMKQEGML